MRDSIRHFLLQLSPHHLIILIIKQPNNSNILALQAASAGGHDKVVQMLMDAGADVNAQGGGYGNALQAAPWGGHDKVAQMLMDAGADINAQGGRYGNALQAASYGGHDKVVQMLMDTGANVNAQGGYYGNTDRRLLLHTCLSVDQPSPFSITATSSAVRGLLMA